MADVYATVGNEPQFGIPELYLVMAIGEFARGKRTQLLANQFVLFGTRTTILDHCWSISAVVGLPDRLKNVHPVAAFLAFPGIERSNLFLYSMSEFFKCRVKLSEGY